ncbi:hypothetical protein H310_15395 [Aphanomyces invadans]|uniref:Uncharacterized protein n=1 Tax=Aphanomyces invadans TaxID=157072 RepID=A0A024T8T2_9STRA|nr:hypothetical protein H310_15395 [Aphanomyces invadans]ETV89777.1 hypothetical protein H310_15395 [Aphanomyces invadans]|eukprot:XP_008881592.1 hypothetical protein H310_15395 [Aphanomyces invadans]
MQQSRQIARTESSAVLRIVRKVGPFMTLVPVALGTSWLIMTQPEREGLLDALETSTHGREYVWEGLLRAFNLTSNLGEGHVVALSHVMSGLLARDSPLIYPNDFRVFVDILVRETTDLDIRDPRRGPLATMLRVGIQSPLYARSGKYRVTEVSAVLAQWKHALEREGCARVMDASTWKALCDAEFALQQA